jgi:polyferredoxin
MAFFLAALFMTSSVFESAYYRFLCAFPVGLNAPVVANPGAPIAPGMSAPVIAAYGATIALFLALAVVMPILTRKRFQCATICPMGAFMSLAGGLSSFKIRVDFSKCDGCMSCADACPFYAIDAEAARARKPLPGRECAKCGECARACPKGAIRLGFAFEKPEHNGCAPSSPFLDPERIFEFTAFLLGMFFSSRFGPDGLTRAYSLITGWL